jgi:hypothetical protein
MKRGWPGQSSVRVAQRQEGSVIAWPDPAALIHPGHLVPSAPGQKTVRATRESGGHCSRSDGQIHPVIEIGGVAGNVAGTSGL